MISPGKDVISVGGWILQAALCPRGCRIYPVSSLALHMLIHDRIDAGITDTHHWAEHRPTKHHVSNRHGRPRKRQSEKAKGVSIRRRGRGAYE